MPIILMDGVKHITLHNGVLRVDCIAADQMPRSDPPAPCSSRPIKFQTW